MADLVKTYLPPQFYERLPPGERDWRGRIVLLLWALGYPLATAWTLGLADDPEQVEFYRQTVAALDDERLRADLIATAGARQATSNAGFETLAE